MVYCLFVSAITIFIQICISHAIREKISESVENKVLCEVLYELVASAELCGTCFELIIVADNYGLSTYCVFLFLMTIWWSRDWGSATACPYNLIEEYVEDGSSGTVMLLKIVAQILGGISSFRWIKQLWLMELSHMHHGRGIDDCSSDLQVPVLFGFIIECILTCCCRLFSRLLGKLQPRYSEAIDSFFATSMVAVAFNYSGGYFNPVLATGLKWGCLGHTNTEHIIVYWAGSIVGSLMSIRLWNIDEVRLRLLATVNIKEEIKVVKVE